MDTEDVARRIIAEAKTNYRNTPDDDGDGGSGDAFDYMIKVEGITPFGELYQAAYRIANEPYPTGPISSDEAELDRRDRDRRERAARLWAEVLPHLEAYAANCRTAEFTGWSRMSKGPLRRVRH